MLMQSIIGYKSQRNCINWVSGASEIIKIKLEKDVKMSPRPLYQAYAAIQAKEIAIIWSLEPQKSLKLSKKKVSMPIFQPIIPSDLHFVATRMTPRPPYQADADICRPYQQKKLQ